MKPVWAARTGTGMDPGFKAFSQSVEEDRPFLLHDLAGSVAHVLGLRKAGLLTAKEAAALVTGLQQLAREAEADRFVLDPALEDVHMNIEAALTATDAPASKLHTGRSRNDQVATCITLYARHGLLALADAAGRLAAGLAAQAEAHTTTPWVAQTHGQSAQPATLGFLLAAHAFRFQDVQEAALRSFEAVGESPLGSGAVAGSTLPLDPAFTAGLLGLRPPRNALLATGARDPIVTTCQTAAQAGLAAASLAQDLLELYTEKALVLPSGFTTGSSLMPHKRNPDALELARGKGKAMQGPLATVTAITSGMGLGYQRDLQLTKPPLVQAVTDAVATLDLLASALSGARFDTDVLAAGLDAPGITATDVAEALVAHGIPFREAYTLVAHAAAMAEQGTPFADALATQGIPAPALAAATAALTPDAARRATLGGPAPNAVQEALARFHHTADLVAHALDQAHQETDQPARLLSAEPATLVAEASW